MAALEPKVIDALLDRLSTDDDFRERFTRDAPAALRELGHAGDASDACLSVTMLASKEEIRKSREALQAQLMSDAGQQPHKLGT